MTNEEMLQLARRAVACKGWRWMPGMRTDDGFRVCRVDSDGYKFGWSDSNYAYAIARDVLPDLTDPATLGCLLELVREAHPAPTITFEGKTYLAPCYPECGSGFWYMRRDCGDGDEDLYEDGVWSWRHEEADPVRGDSEAEVLVAALEAAP
jgi:hypothetical protein